MNKYSSLFFAALASWLMLGVSILPRESSAGQNSCASVFSKPGKSSSVSSADSQTVFRERVARQYVGVLRKVVSNLQGRELIMRTLPDGNEIHASLGRRLGAGAIGSAYVLRSLKDSHGQDILASGEHVAKFPHSLPMFPQSPIGASNRENQREYDFFSVVQRTWQKAQSNRMNNRLKAFPVVPISHILNTDYGVVLVKPLVNGKGIEKLKAKSRLPNLNQENALRELFALTEELQSVIEKHAGDEPIVRRYLGSEGLVLDLNMRNIVWLDKSEVNRLRAQGIDFGFDEGFAYFELTPLKNREKRTLDGFLEEYRDAVQR